MTPKFLTVSEKGTDALPISKDSGIERAVDILLEEIIKTSVLSSLSFSLLSAAAHETLQVKQKLPLRKRKVSARTKHLYESRRRHCTTLSENERKEMSNAVSKSGREDYPEYVTEC